MFSALLLQTSSSFTFPTPSQVSKPSFLGHQKNPVHGAILRCGTPFLSSSLPPCMAALPPKSFRLPASSLRKISSSRSSSRAWLNSRSSSRSCEKAQTMHLGEQSLHRRGRISVNAVGDGPPQDPKPDGEAETKTGKSTELDNQKAFDGLVDSVSSSLAKSFGKPVWFAILLASLAVFGGGYAYLIVSFADFSRIPILNGPGHL